jgi:uncharacterized protein (DUF302 family)
MEMPGTREGMRSTSIDLDLHMRFETAVEQVRAALKEQGFGVLTEIDVQATMKEKLDADFRPYIILGACNPTLAYRALSADLGIGLMLPCTVIVYEIEAERSRVQIMDPVAVLALAQNEQITPIAHEAKDRLEKVADTLRETDGLARGAA